MSMWTKTKTKRYWQQRTLELEQINNKKAQATNKKNNAELELLHDDITKEIESFYSRYSTENGITKAEAYKQLSDKEMEMFNLSLEEFKALSLRENFATEAAYLRQKQILDRISIKIRITRLDMLRTQVSLKLVKRYGNIERNIEAMLRETYKDSYYWNIYGFHQTYGKMFQYAKLTDEMLDSVMQTKAFGKNYSTRIWGDDHAGRLTKKINSALNNIMAGGKNVDAMAGELSKAFNTSKSNAKRLLITETTLFADEAAQNAYKEFSVEEYENLATLDSKTSQKCRDMDNSVFPVSKREVGVNAPPFHGYCRTVTLPVVKPLVDLPEMRVMKMPGSRAKNIRSMSYNDWLKGQSIA
ncbi:minor capsid protein [Culicoidibacter larvae]|nr:minor capsid protein [Culicoidibacter larvae]